MNKNNLDFKFLSNEDFEYLYYYVCFLHSQLSDFYHQTNENERWCWNILKEYQKFIQKFEKTFKVKKNKYSNIINKIEVNSNFESWWKQNYLKDEIPIIPILKN